MKWLLRIVVALVLLVVLVAVGAVVFVDPIAKTAVETGGTQALGVETKLEKMGVGLFSGDVKMERLRVANPEGFSSEPLLAFGTFAVGVRTTSLLGETVEVRNFELDGLDINIEQKGMATNVTTIMDNLKKVSTSAKPKETPKAQQAEGKKVSVTTIVIKNVKATFRLSVLGGKPIVVNVPLIKMENVTSDNAKGVAIKELVARVVPAILKGVFEAAKDIVPGGFLADMNGQLQSVSKALGGQAEKLMNQAGDQVKDSLIKALGTQPADLIKKVPGGLLPGKLPDKLPGTLLPK